MKIFSFALCFLSFLSLLAFILHVAFVNPPGPTLVVEQASRAWVAAMLTLALVVPLFLAQISTEARDGQTSSCSCCFGEGRVSLASGWLAWSTLWSVLLLCGVGMAGDGVAIVYAFVLMVVLALGALSVVRYRSVLEEMVDVLPASKGVRVLRGTTLCVSVCCLGVMLPVLAVGALTAGSLAVTYGPRGDFMTVSLGDEADSTYEILVHCEGPEGNGSTIVLEADASHGAPDFWPLQRALVERGRRVCISDKPGLGFSSLRFATEAGLDDTLWYPSYLEQVGEPPYTLVGWGGGGELVYSVARILPAGTVSSLVFLSTYAPNVEFRVHAAMNDQTAEEAAAYREVSLGGRQFLFNIIRGLGVPLGLISIFIPPSDDYAWPEREPEYRAPYLQAKTWCTQNAFANQIVQQAKEAPVSSRGVFDDPPLNATDIPIAALVVAQNRTIICEGVDDAAACDDRVKQAKLYEADARATANVTGTAVIVDCSDADCSLGLPLNLPEVAADVIVSYG